MSFLLDFMMQNQWLVTLVIVATLLSCTALAIAYCLRYRPALAHGVLLATLGCLVIAPALCFLVPHTIRILPAVAQSGFSDVGASGVKIVGLSMRVNTDSERIEPERTSRAQR